MSSTAQLCILCLLEIYHKLVPKYNMLVPNGVCYRGAPLYMPSIIVCWYALLCLAPSGPPLGISAIALGPRVIQISWNQPLPEEENGFIRSYTVNVTVTETGQHMQFTTNNTTITAEGLHPYFNYHISVAAVTIAIGPYSEIYSLQTPQDGK